MGVRGNTRLEAGRYGSQDGRRYNWFHKNQGLVK
jgi:hypothetical protein